MTRQPWETWPPEPWSIDGGSLNFGAYTVPGTTEIWPRITACVNALHGIRNPAAVQVLIEYLQEQQPWNAGGMMGKLLAALDAEPTP